jgi:tight adherence protein C
MDLGATRREAFEALRARNGSQTMDSFVAAQLQAEELGVPLADALASIAEDTRRAAAQQARRRAQRATPRITLIAIALLLPATIMLILTGMIIGSGVNFSHVLGS